MTKQRYGENFEPLFKQWHLWAVVLVTLYASVAPSFGWWPHAPLSWNSLFVLLGLCGVFALTDMIRGQLYAIMLSNQKSW